MAAHTAKHSAENPDLVQKRLDRRKALEDTAKGDYTDSDIRTIRIQLNDECRFCSKPLNKRGEIDHLTPLSRGGTNFPRNLTLTCLPCNREKTNKTRDEYLQWRMERGMDTRNIWPPSEDPDEPSVCKGQKVY